MNETKNLSCHLYFGYGVKNIKFKTISDFSMARAIRRCCRHFKLSVGAVKVVAQSTGQEVRGYAGDYAEQKLIITKRCNKIRFIWTRTAYLTVHTTLHT